MRETALAGDRAIRIAAWVALVLLVAGLTHLGAILMLPRVATKDAYDLLAVHAPTNRIMLLAPARPGDALIPFRDPSTVQGLCFYDVGAAPVRVKLKVEEGRLLTLSFRTREGRVFYSMTDRAALNGVIDIRLVTALQLDAIEANDSEDQGLPPELRLKVPAARGLFVATILIERPSQAREAAEQIKSIACQSEPVSPPS